MPSLRALPTMLVIGGGVFRSHVGAMRVLCPMPRSYSSRQFSTALRAGDDRWWDGPKFLGGIATDGDSSGGSSGASGRQSDGRPSLITPEMEEEVLASARAAVDGNTVSRAISSLIKDDGAPKRGGNVQSIDRYDNNKKGKNSLRDLALSTTDNGNIQNGISNDNQSKGSNSNVWDTQQIAIASGATTFLLSPLVVPILHSILPPIIPSPSSISVTGAALLGTLSYIIALGDPADQSNMISGSTGGVLGDGVEVGGAVSRIVGRTALQSVQTSAPRLKAAARAMVDYDTTTATLEELQRAQSQLSQTVLELETENETLRKEVALWQAVEDVSSMYKLEELKEMARYEGVKGYSTEGKNALLRRLVREGILKLDLTPYN